MEKIKVFTSRTRLLPFIGQFGAASFFPDNFRHSFTCNGLVTVSTYEDGCCCILNKSLCYQVCVFLGDI